LEYRVKAIFDVGVITKKIPARAGSSRVTKEEEEEEEETRRVEY